MKKLLLYILCFVLSMSVLASCNKETDSTPDANDNTDNNTSTDETPDDGNTGDDNTGDDNTGDEGPNMTDIIDVKEAFQAIDGELPYRLYVPDDYSEGKTYPVLLFLHGAGERGSDNEAQLKNVIQKLFDDPTSPVYQSIVIVPQCPEGEQWVDTPWADGNYDIRYVEESNELGAVLNILDSIQSTYSVNENRIYVMGISMGGFGTWDLLMRHGDLFAAAIPICGGGDINGVYNLLDKPIYTCHGDADGTVPVEGTRELYQSIVEDGGEMITYEELAGYGHNVWDYVAEKEGLMDWLFAQVLENE